MWCVPTAVAALTGTSREKVWLDILAERYERPAKGLPARRLTNAPGRINEPHGGLHAAEALRVIERAGYEAIDWWRGTKRLSVAEFLSMVDQFETDYGYRGRWLILQRMHMAHYDGDVRAYHNVGSLIPGLPIAKAWRIERPVPKWETYHAGATDYDPHRWSDMDEQMLMEIMG